MSAMPYEGEASALGGSWTVCCWLQKNSVHMYPTQYTPCLWYASVRWAARIVGLLRSPSLFEAVGPTGPVYSLTSE